MITVEERRVAVTGVTYSILVATMNRPQAVANMLASVERQTFLPGEFILVDQSKNDETQKVCESYAKRIAGRGQLFRYVRQEVPSLVKARKRGVEESSGDIICFIDDDVILEPEYFARIASYFNDPAVGGVTGNVRIENPPRGWKWHIRKFMMRIFLLSSFDGRLTASTFGYPIFERQVNEVQRVELFGGYSMNFRRPLVLRHMPDDWFSGYGFREDVDLSYRISRDATMIIVPDARFAHDASTINRLDIGNLKKMQFKNYFYMFKKYRRFGAATWVLFWYSLIGVVLLDLLEFVFNFNRNKWLAFTANFSAIKEMFRA